MPIQDVDLKTYLKRWTIEKGGGRVSGISGLIVRHDDDDDDDEKSFLSTKTLASWKFTSLYAYIYIYI